MEKREFILVNNVREYVTGLGSSAVFVTVTFPAGTPHEIVRKRWNSFTTNFLKGVFASWIAVTEFQKNGTIHYHLVADAGFDAATGFGGFYKVNGRTYARGANEALKGLWQRLREAAPSYGVGRIQTEPVRSPKNSGFYLAKYLSKAIGVKPKGMRMIAYSRVNRVYTMKFSFVYGYRKYLAYLGLLSIFKKGECLPKTEITVKHSYSNFLSYKSLKRQNRLDWLNDVVSSLTDFLRLRETDRSLFSEYRKFLFDDGGLVFLECSKEEHRLTNFYHYFKEKHIDRHQPMTENAYMEHLLTNTEAF